MKPSTGLRAAGGWCVAFAAAFLGGGGAPVARARFVDRYTPDQFVAQADVVCNGIPMEMNQTEETTRLLFDKNHPEEGGQPMRYVVARVRVISRARESHATIMGRPSPARKAGPRFAKVPGKAGAGLCRVETREGRQKPHERHARRIPGTRGGGDGQGTPGPVRPGLV